MKGKSFKADIAKFAAKVSGTADQAVRKIALGIFANIVTASPVDTGRFRGNWLIGLQSRPTEQLDVEVKDPTAVTQREGEKLGEAKAGITIYLSNNLPYALRLEYGYSRQAPAGMVRTTIANLDQIVEGAVRS
jgi:hypothetical protein